MLSCLLCRTTQLCPRLSDQRTTLTVCTGGLLPSIVRWEQRLIKCVYTLALHHHITLYLHTTISYETYLVMKVLLVWHVSMHVSCPKSRSWQHSVLEWKYLQWHSIFGSPWAAGFVYLTAWSLSLTWERVYVLRKIYIATTQVIGLPRDLNAYAKTLVSKTQAPSYMLKEPFRLLQCICLKVVILQLSEVRAFWDLAHFASYCHILRLGTKHQNCGPSEMSIALQHVMRIAPHLPPRPAGSEDLPQYPKWIANNGPAGVFAFEAFLMVTPPPPPPSPPSPYLSRFLCLAMSDLLCSVVVAARDLSILETVTVSHEPFVNVLLPFRFWQLTRQS